MGSLDEKTSLKRSELSGISQWHLHPSHTGVTSLPRSALVCFLAWAIQRRSMSGTRRPQCALSPPCSLFTGVNGFD